jgi:hypothetical protein
MLINAVSKIQELEAPEFPSRLPVSLRQSQNQPRFSANLISSLPPKRGDCLKPPFGNDKIVIK